MYSWLSKYWNSIVSDPNLATMTISHYETDGMIQFLRLNCQRFVKWILYHIMVIIYLTFSWLPGKKRSNLPAAWLQPNPTWPSGVWPATPWWAWTDACFGSQWPRRLTACSWNPRWACCQCSSSRHTAAVAGLVSGSGLVYCSRHSSSRHAAAVKATQSVV